MIIISDPKIKNFLPNRIFKDMEEFIRKIYFHIISKNKITITFCDYIVDNTSAAQNI